MVIFPFIGISLSFDDIAFIFAIRTQDLIAIITKIILSPYGLVVYTT